MQRTAPASPRPSVTTPVAFATRSIGSPGTRALRAALLAAACLLGGCASGGGSGAGSPVGNLIESGDVQLVQITPQLVAASRGEKQEPVPKVLLDYRPDSYRINPGDTIQVTVWDHPELNANAGGPAQDALANGRLVHPDGTFYYPFVGTLKVAGMKIEDLRNVITTRLATYLQSPQVDVNLVGYGSRVTLSGAFKDTSSQSITTVPLTLSQAVGAAVVDTEQADLSGLVLTRDGENHRIDLDALSRNGNSIPNIYLKPGDRLYLPFNDRQQAYVLGEVLRPQAITFKTADMTLTQALGRVGGLNPVTAKSDAVYVIRGMDPQDMNSKPATVFQLDASEPAAFALADEFSVKPGDVVFVGEAGVTRWNRFLSQLLPLSGIIRNASAPTGN
ncbi:MAG TPA: polysaccharide biosynthesis/export family protein [Luteimonas sp.]|nr:polysaccharide biosynthesis/export family protein [Luteimonas sp.]